MRPTVHPTAVRYPDVIIGNGTIVHEFAVLGKPYRPVSGAPFRERRYTKVGMECYVGSHTTIGKGSVIEAGCIVDDYVKIESNVTVRQGCLIIYSA